MKDVIKESPLSIAPKQEGQPPYINTDLASKKSPASKSPISLAFQAAEKINYPPVKTKPLPENREDFQNIGFRKANVLDDGSSPKFDKPKVKVLTEEEQKKANEDAKLLVKRFRREGRKREKEKVNREIEARRK